VLPQAKEQGLELTGPNGLLNQSAVDPSTAPPITFTVGVLVGAQVTHFSAIGVTVGLRRGQSEFVG